jgi:hypothetical protein
MACPLAPGIIVKGTASALAPGTADIAVDGISYVRGAAIFSGTAYTGATPGIAAGASPVIIVSGAA